MSAVVADSTPSGDYVAPFPDDDHVAASTNHVQDASVKARRSPFNCVKRAWFAFRWKLSTCIFSRPVPFLTTSFDLKLGDVLITLPVAAAVLAINANLCAKQEVKESGGLPMIAMIVVFALTVRNNSILLTLTGLPFERALLYHKFFGVVALLLAGLHGLAYLLEDAGVAVARRRRLRAANTSGGGPLMEQKLSGAICFYLMAALLVLSLPPIRRRFYEAFLRLHWLLFLGIVAFAIIHGAGGVVVGLIPWALDLVFRHGYLVQKYFRGGWFRVFACKSGSSRPGVISQQQVSFCHLPGGILRIQFPRVRADTGESFKYEAGQYVFLCVPKLSLLEWHPFTISSSPHEVLVTIHIKALGDWTKKLLEEVPLTTDGHHHVVPAPFAILVDGPYGSVSVDIENPTTYSHVALFSGGIGITPMQAIANQLHFDFCSRGRAALKKVHFVWAVRERAMVEAMMNTDFVEARKLLQGHTPAYLPDELLSAGPNGRSISPHDVFKSEFFLTRGQPDPENPLDRRLQPCLRYNTRPDVAEILTSLGQDALKHGKKRVAVLVCGPAALVRDVRIQAMKLERSSKAKFDVHTECFDF